MGLTIYRAGDVAIDAGDTAVVTFPGAGGARFAGLCAYAKVVLGGGDGVAFSLEVAAVPDPGADDWFDVKVVDAAGTSEETLVSTVTLVADAAAAVFTCEQLATAVRVSMKNNDSGTAATVSLVVLAEG